MDLLFVRYASPFSLLDSYISIGGLNDFIFDLYEFVNDDKLWEYFLHKVYEGSWGDFLKSTKPVEVKTVDVEATINKSREMLNNFTP